jgi:hypothetical protein
MQTIDTRELLAMEQVKIQPAPFKHSSFIFEELRQGRQYSMWPKALALNMSTKL